MPILTWDQSPPSVVFIRRNGKFLKNGGSFVINNEDCCCCCCEDVSTNCCDDIPATIYIDLQSCPPQIVTLTEDSPSRCPSTGRTWSGSAVLPLGTINFIVICETSTRFLSIQHDACTGNWETGTLCSTTYHGTDPCTPELRTYSGVISSCNNPDCVNMTALIYW